MASGLEKARLRGGGHAVPIGTPLPSLGEREASGFTPKEIANICRAPGPLPSVEHQEQVVVAQSAQPRQVIAAAHVHPAFALTSHQHRDDGRLWPQRVGRRRSSKGTRTNGEQRFESGMSLACRSQSAFDRPDVGKLFPWTMIAAIDPCLCRRGAASLCSSFASSRSAERRSHAEISASLSTRCLMQVIRRCSKCARCHLASARGQRG